jgi:pimeloyl-ACP methyl ester carboxylesterase
METLFNSPDKFKSKFATADGYRTHYIEAGREDADRLLLVHGGGNEIGMGNYRYPNIIPLSKRFRVFAIDELGHGQTDPPRNVEDLANVRVRADHVISFIETLKLAPINLAGQSQGGWIVTYITLTRPDLVKKLVLIDSGSTAGHPMELTDQPAGSKLEVDGIEVTVGSRELPYFKEVFEPGTMMPKEGLTTTREGIRKYVGAFFYDKSMLTEELLDHLMEQVLYGDNGIVKTARPGTIVVDMSTMSIAFQKERFAQLSGLGFRPFEAPVSGSVPHAEGRALTIMGAGDQALFAKLKPVFATFGKTVVYLGPAGNGTLMKLLTNLILGINLAGLLEGLILGQKGG